MTFLGRWVGAAIRFVCGRTCSAIHVGFVLLLDLPDDEPWVDTVCCAVFGSGFELNPPDVML